MAREVTHQRLKDILDYDPATGVFRWRSNRGGTARKGAKAGCAHTRGYIRIALLGGRYYAHRLAWLYVHGVWPDGDIDHKNQITSDNRIVNLRLASSSQNLANARRPTHNRSGFKGVSWDKSKGRWQVHIKKDGAKYFIGRFDDLVEAAKAYDAKAIELHGEYALTNFLSDADAQA